MKFGACSEYKDEILMWTYLSSEPSGGLKVCFKFSQLNGYNRNNENLQIARSHDKGKFGDEQARVVIQ